MSHTSIMIGTRSNERRTLLVRVAVVATSLVLAGCGENDDGTSRVPTIASADEAPRTAPSDALTTDVPSTEATENERVPDGTYRRVITAADSEGLGIDPGFVADFVGPDGEMPLALRIAGDAFEILITNDAGVEEVGDVGSIGYRDGGRLVVVDSTEANLAIDWAHDAGRLTTELVGGTDSPDSTLVWTGTWSLGGPDSDGEAAADGVTLTFANPLTDLPTPIIAFLTEARDTSSEAITWDVTQSAGSEQEIIASVLAGVVDMAWVGARAFPEFDAMLAPMLVDSYELQTAVFEEGIVDRLAETLAARGLKVLAVYPGPLQRAVGVGQPIANAADFQGRAIGLGLIERPPLQVATVEALGATPTTFQEYMDISVLDGFIAQLGAVTGNSWENEVASVTANLNFWPRPLVVFTTVERFDQLAAPVQDALNAGGDTAFDAAAAAALQDDAGSLESLCGATAELIELGDADLAEVRARLEPVYEELAEDPTTAGFIATIEAVKEELAVPPTLATCAAR